MVKSSCLSVAIIATLLLCANPAFAQQSNTPEKYDKATEELRGKAFALLESLAGQLGGLQSAENRARFGSNIAGSLWPHDEKRARSLIIDVQNEINLGMLQSLEGNEPDMHSLMVFLNLRRDTVQRIAKHDPELAYSFLVATKLRTDKKLPEHIAASDRALELKLADQIAANNPDLALKLGRASLERGFSDDLLTVLKQLNKKKTDHGTLFYQDIVAKLKNGKLVEDWNLRYFANRLARLFTPPDIDELAYRDLMNLFLSSAVAYGCESKTPAEDGRYFCREVAALLPQMERVDAARAGILKRWQPQQREVLSMESQYGELRSISRDGSIDEILTLAAKYPQAKGNLYWTAMVKAQSAGDMERARKIANDFDGSPNQRTTMLEFLERSSKWSTLNEGTLGEVQRKLQSLRSAREQIAFLIAVSQQLGATNREGALKLLEQAIGIADSMKPGKEQAEMQISVATMFSLEKSTRGFAIIESLMPKLNSLVDASTKLDGFGSRILRDGEWNMSAESSVGSLLTVLAQNSGYFAWLDFDSAQKMTAQFERQEIRMMAQLKLAQGILSGPPKRLYQDIESNLRIRD
jgi:hypothetical protein